MCLPRVECVQTIVQFGKIEKAVAMGAMTMDGDGVDIASMCHCESALWPLPRNNNNYNRTCKHMTV